MNNACKPFRKSTNVLQRLILLSVLTLAMSICAFAQNVTVNPGAGSYLDLTSAFNAINAGTHTGAVVVTIFNNTNEPAGSAVLNSSGAGAASYTSMLIRPGGDGVIVTGTTVLGRGMIELNGADNVTIDGDNPFTGGTNRNLTITNVAVSTTTYTSVIRIALATTIVTSADNDTLKNLILNGSALGRNTSTATSTVGSENTTYGIIATAGASTVAATTPPTALASVSTTIGTGATATNLTIQNNSITTVARAVAIQGSATTVFPGLLIENNTIGSAFVGFVDGVYSMGVTAQGSTNTVIRGNTVYIESYLAGQIRGLEFGSISTSGSTALFETNKVLRVRNNNPGSFGAYGINLGGGSSHGVRNNFVTGVINVANGTFTTAFGAYGIRIASGTGHQIYHNSVNMTGVLTGTGNALTCGLIHTASTQTGMDIRNNILANSQSGGGASSAFASLCLFNTTLTNVFNLTLNNNDYFEGPNALNAIAQAGVFFGTGVYKAANFDASTTTPSTNLRAYTSILNAADTNDNSSKVVDPGFVSATDLHITSSSPMEGMGVDVGVMTDIDGDARGATPDIGADEVVAPTAANAYLAGRVSTASGRAISNASVSLQGTSSAERMAVRTNTFGYYQFDDLAVGQTYIVTVRARGYTFAEPSRVIVLGDNVENFDFVAQPEE